MNYSLIFSQLSQTLADNAATPPACPECHSSQVFHWGRSHGHPRYRCKLCGETFDHLKRTALSGLRHKEKWVAYAGCLDRGLSLRTAAQECGINTNTAMLWRHRFLRYANNISASHP